jgi:hypothetical protein
MLRERHRGDEPVARGGGGTPRRERVPRQPLVEHAGGVSGDVFRGCVLVATARTRRAPRLPGRGRGAPESPEPADVRFSRESDRVRVSRVVREPLDLAAFAPTAAPSRREKTSRSLEAPGTCVAETSPARVFVVPRASAPPRRRARSRRTHVFFATPAQKFSPAKSSWKNSSPFSRRYFRYFPRGRGRAPEAREVVQLDFPRRAVSSIFFLSRENETWTLPHPPPPLPPSSSQRNGAAST